MISNEFFGLINEKKIMYTFRDHEKVRPLREIQDLIEKCYHIFCVFKIWKSSKH